MTLQLINAELVRILRTEISWQRLVFVPAIALLILYLLQTREDVRLVGVDVAEFDHDAWFMVFAAGWGSFSLIWSMKEEFNNRTWYWQVMLPLTPLQLLTGRLFGVLLLPWLGGLLVLLPVLFTEQALLVILTAALTNAVAFFLVLVTVRDGKAQMAIPFLVTALFLFSGGDQIFAEDSYAPWYGWMFNTRLFVYTSMLLYILLVLLGCYRQLAGAKQYPPQPLWWLLFLLFYLGYGGGFYKEFAFLEFDNPTAALPRYLLMLWFLSWSALYICAFLNSAAGTLLFIDMLRQGGVWGKTLEHGTGRLFIDMLRQGGVWWRHVPPWLVTAALMWLAALLYCASAPYHDRYIVGAAMLAFSFLALRDIAILLMFTMRPGVKLPEGITIIVLLVLYLLIPYLFDRLGIGVYWLVPVSIDVSDEPVRSMLRATVSILSAAAQCALALYWLWRLRIYKPARRRRRR